MRIPVRTFDFTQEAVKNTTVTELAVTLTSKEEGDAFITALLNRKRRPEEEAIKKLFKMAGRMLTPEQERMAVVESVMNTVRAAQSRGDVTLEQYESVSRNILGGNAPGVIRGFLTTLSGATDQVSVWVAVDNSVQAALKDLTPEESKQWKEADPVEKLRFTDELRTSFVGLAKDWANGTGIILANAPTPPTGRDADRLLGFLNNVVTQASGPVSEEAQ
jgi:hypothetical protein